MELQENIADEFNEFSRNYTEDMVACVPYYLELLNLFTNNFPSSFRPSHILDLGCGNGNVSARLLDVFPNSLFELIDASDKMLDLCKQRFSKTKEIRYTQTYFKDYQFKNDNFDLVAAGFSLHHCASDEKQLLFKQIFDALKPGGIFLCSDLMIEKSQNEHVQLIEDWKKFVTDNYPDVEKWNWIMEHYDEFDNPNAVENQLKWLKTAGFNHFDVTIYDQYWTHFKAHKA